MKKLIFLPLCVFILFSTLLAQNVELTWAPDLNRENFILNDFNPFHLDDNAYYVLGSKRREASILKFDLNHNFISQTNYTDVKEKQHIAPEKK